MVVLHGDFNFRHVTWSPSENFGYLVSITVSNGADMFFKEISDLKLLQYNQVPNCNGRILELCFGNFSKIVVNRCPSFSLHEKAYHSSLRYLSMPAW